MYSKEPRLIRFTLTAGSLLFLVSGCTDEEKIFVDKPLFEDPPAAAQGFLGYDEEGQKLTVCGNCHVGQQADWEGTAHADAWNTLQGSGHSQDACENCHSVGPLGNPSSGTVGYAGTSSSRYHDVQCESCHGPGQTHVANPDASQPLAAITVGLDLDSGCGECHSGAHHPFVEDWSQSLHATMNESVRDRAVEDPAAASTCLGCHSGQGALRAWGVNAEYTEKDAPAASHLGIVCAVCHDPHDGTNSGQLRFPIDVPDENVNLCMKCHNRRAQPEVNSATLRGPHAPEGPLLLGEAGWFPPGFELEGVVGTHGTESNDRLCAACHVATYQVNDQSTGQFLVSVTGHRFEAIPCVDANGIPTDAEECDIQERAFNGCVSSGCHGAVESARSAYVTSKQRIANLVEEVDAILKLVPEGELDQRDGRFTTADGAWFNARLGELPGTSTHNPFLAEQLLVASIQAVRDQYEIPGVTGVSLDIQLGQ